MPLSTCVHCGRQQMIRQDLVGLLVACAQCGAEFRAVEDRPTPRPTPPAPVWDAGTVTTVLKAAGLIVGLLALVGALMAVAVWVFDGSPARTAATKSVPQPPPRPDPPPTARPPSGEGRDADRQAVDVAKDVASAVWVGFVVLLTAYLAAVIAAGGWVAKDANARGMPGLGWASFYYLFHLLSRGFVGVLQVVGMVSAGLAVTSIWTSPFRTAVSSVGVVVSLLAVELAAWSGLLVYLSVRRAGSCPRCRRCNNRRLGYLVACPHCGVRDPAD